MTKRCVFLASVKGTSCARGCGRVLKIDFPKPPYALCKSDANGLGDWTAIIIQKLRLQAVARFIYRMTHTTEVVKSQCGKCEVRRDKLNRLGYILAELWNRPLRWLGIKQL